MRSKVQSSLVHEEANSIYIPSEYWKYLNNKNINQLKNNGFKNFKRTISLNYFTWVVSPFDPQIKFLIKKINKRNIFVYFLQTLITKPQKPMNVLITWSYTFLTKILWEYVDSIDNNSALNLLEEPTLGNPPRIYYKGKLISQDLANSYLEYRSIFNSKVSIKSVIEVGPGYGRTAFVILKLNPEIKYFFVDIHPALDVCQQYMSKIFIEKKIFKFRKFNSYSDVKNEISKSQLIFLTPDQISLLPKKSVDLFINISSFHEMRKDQVNFYFQQMDRIIKSYIYFKQWKDKEVPIDGHRYTSNSYSLPSGWEKIYKRTCKVQTNFFEAFYEKRK